MIPDISWAEVQACACDTNVNAGKLGKVVSIGHDPLGASIAWSSQKQPSSHMAEGAIVIESNGENLFSGINNVELHETWSKILTAIVQVLENGEGSADLGFQSKKFSLNMNGAGLIVAIDRRKYLASPRRFIESLIAGAENFYAWYERYIPGNIEIDLENLNKIKLISKF